jgi:hypothetical protein
LAVKSKNKNRSCFIRQFLERNGEGKYMVGRKIRKNERRGNAKEKGCICIGR